MRNISNEVLIDTNVLLRYLLRDNEKQYKTVCEWIGKYDCIVLSNVVQEAVYVLSGSSYKVPRNIIKETIFDSFKLIQYAEQDVIERALEIFTEKPKLDFPDCLLIAYNQLQMIPVLTFDKKMNKKLEQER